MIILYYYIFFHFQGKTRNPFEGFEEIIIGIGCAFLLILLLLVLFFVWYKRNLKLKYGLYLEPNEEFVVSKLVLSILLLMCLVSSLYVFTLREEFTRNFAIQREKITNFPNEGISKVSRDLILRLINILQKFFCAEE